MGKVIGIIASLDTKEIEVAFLSELIRRSGHDVFIIDVGAEKCSLIEPQIDAVTIAKEVGHYWVTPIDIQKSKMIEVLSSGVARLIPQLYNKGLFDALLSIGGLQNTTIAVNAMKTLPIGFPKFIVSTVASGKRSFETIVGNTDIMVMPSIADFSGRNIITDTILENAAASVIGIVERAGKPLCFSDDLLIGITTMGVVNRGTSHMVKALKGRGYEVVSFHSTGVGGGIMDDLVDQGVIKATVEFSLHEIIGELFGGYSSGTIGRLINSSQKGIPQLVTPGACDFIDLETTGLTETRLNRKHIYHNTDLVHIKLSKIEISKVGEVIAARLNKSNGPVTILVPLRGFRVGTKAGNSLYDPDVDMALINVLKQKIRDGVRFVEVDANINDDEFVHVALNEMEQLLS